MSGMPPLFPTVLVGAALSPHTDALLHEAWRLTEKLGERLIVAHATTGNAEEARQELEGRVSRNLPFGAKAEVVVVESGRAAGVLTEIAAERKVDLILAGALAQERLITRLIGSVARRLAREAPCSVLLLPSEKDRALPFRIIVVSVDASDEAEAALAVATSLARRDPPEKLVAMWEYQVPGLAMALAGGSDAESRAQRDEVQHEEEAQLASLLRTADLTNLPVEAVCRYGEPGWVVSEYARTAGADLLVVPAPSGGGGIVDRLFAAGTDVVLRRLSYSVLLVRQAGLAAREG